MAEAGASALAFAFLPMIAIGTTEVAQEIPLDPRESEREADEPQVRLDLRPRPDPLHGRESRV